RPPHRLFRISHPLTPARSSSQTLAAGSSPTYRNPSPRAVFRPGSPPRTCHAPISDSARSRIVSSAPPPALATSPLPSASAKHRRSSHRIHRGPPFRRAFRPAPSPSVLEMAHIQEWCCLPQRPPLPVDSSRPPESGEIPPALPVTPSWLGPEFGLHGGAAQLRPPRYSAD